MNAKPWISAIALCALLAEQALPAHAGRMPCDMGGRGRAEACTHCDEDGDALVGASIRIACCRTGPAPVILPVVLAGSRGDDTPERRAASFLLPITPGLDSALARSLKTVPRPVSPPPLELPTRTTILRN